MLGPPYISRVLGIDEQDIHFIQSLIKHDSISDWNEYVPKLLKCYDILVDTVKQTTLAGSGDSEQQVTLAGNWAILQRTHN